jgi:hypothetical protein
MIKHIRTASAVPTAYTEWLNLSDEVEVELTSEHPEWPIEGALLRNHTAGWRAGSPGPQTIVLTWPSPITLRRVQVVFEECSRTRTQEFALCAVTGQGRRELVRQQFTFAPPGTTIEREEYASNVEGVRRLELTIVPAVDDADAIATLKAWRVA